MQVFKVAMKSIFRKPVYLLLYGLLLSVLGVFVTTALYGDATDSDANTDFKRADVSYSVIDRDGSQISKGVRDRLSSCGTEVPLEDSKIALQDAIAKGSCAYVLIIPAGYGDALMREAHGGEAAPALDYVYGYYSMEGAVLNEAVGEFVSLARSYAMAHDSANQRAVCDAVTDIVAEEVAVESISSSASVGGYEPFVYYLGWSAYTLFAAIVACVALAMCAVNRTDVRNRSIVSPVRNESFGIQKALACGAVGLIVVALGIAVGLVFFGYSAFSMSAPGFILCVAVVLCYAAIPLSLGFFLGELGVSELVCNVISNAAGMTITFFGGVWVPLDLLSSEVQTIAHFLPGYWYTSALEGAAKVQSFAESSMPSLLTSMGILLLFAAVFVALGLVASRLKMQTRDAGGNAAAELA